MITHVRGKPTVIATTSPGKHETVRALDADHVLDSRGLDLAAEVLRLTGGEAAVSSWEARLGDDRLGLPEAGRQRGTPSHGLGLGRSGIHVESHKTFWRGSKSDSQLRGRCAWQ
ncbi:MAG TPA: hypothetical protein VFQ68_26165 [Streptosporangiaceae bacterium]|nr:hypothetical protein [Streptosporangiaceae bacterium]